MIYSIIVVCIAVMFRELFRNVRAQEMLNVWSHIPPARAFRKGGSYELQVRWNQIYTVVKHVNQTKVLNRCKQKVVNSLRAWMWTCEDVYMCNLYTCISCFLCQPLLSFCVVGNSDCGPKLPLTNIKHHSGGKRRAECSKWGRSAQILRFVLPFMSLQISWYRLFHYLYLNMGNPRSRLSFALKPR